MKALALQSSLTMGLLLGACGGDEPETAADHIGAVQTQLNAGDMGAAEIAADAALGVVESTSGAGLELQGQKLQALAQSGQTEAATQLLKDLYSSHPQQFGYEDFLVVGAWLAEAGDCTGAVDFLAYGDETSSDQHALFEDAVMSAGSACGSGGGDELIEQLKSLGYM